MNSENPTHIGFECLANVWHNQYFSWAMVAFGIAFLYFIPAPSLIRQLVQCGKGFTPGNLAVLGYLLFIAIVPIVGLWRLSLIVNLPRLLALLYLFFPLITVIIYVARVVINFMLPDEF